MIDIEAMRTCEQLTVDLDDERNAQIASTCTWIEQNCAHNKSSRLRKDELVGTSVVSYSARGAEKRLVTGKCACICWNL